MIKILFFIPGLSGGGAEKVLCNLVNNMDQTKFDITVQTIEYNNPEDYLVKGIHYKSIFKKRCLAGRKILNYWYRFCTEFKLTYQLYIRDNYDIEVAFLECGATKVMAASTNKHAAKFAWVHCDVKKKGLSPEKTGKYYTKFNQIVCVSEAAAQSYEELFGRFAHPTVLYNVIDEKQILDNSKLPLNHEWDKRIVHIVSVGRLCYEKGSDRLVNVCRMLKDAGLPFCCHFVGDGLDRHKLETMVASYGLTEQVVFEGFAKNPYPYMENADIVVIPSRSEALSTVAIESLILGKAIVTTPCSGMEELIGRYHAGIITEDSEVSMYEAIKAVADSDSLREMYEKTSKKRGLDFSKKKMVHMAEALFCNSIDKE